MSAGVLHIGGRAIGPGRPPFILAEMSGNHGGSLKRALAIAEAAAKAGAHGLKLQTYTPDTMTIDLKKREFVIRDPKSPWKGRALYDLYKEAHTPWEWHREIFARCKKLGLVCFSTPFDETAVDFLEKLGAPAYKIASFENTDLPLIRRTAKTGKPLIISTGMATIGEIGEAVAAAGKAGCRELILLKCTSSYPADPAGSNLRAIPALARRFGVPVGLSDHTAGIGAAVAAVALGAVMIEKHLMLRSSDRTVDSAFSLEPEEMASLVRESAVAWQALGTSEYSLSKEEGASLRLRRSLYVVKDMKAGERLSLENLRCIRPGLGLAPKHLDEVLGRKVRRGVRRGTPLSWELLR